ncbi:acetylornithine carbamoyltransferase [Robiginitalea sp. IMCC44478]|uniref:acetylornithine carbamoyltransferase n=1 Tax=Robiginitalea sp. IMCC44478 TaxID=3459122 RepID=UPI004042508B
MNHFRSIEDIRDFEQWLLLGEKIRENPGLFQKQGRGKTICLLFFNNSLRTRLSTQKAAKDLGMEVMTMNFGTEGWMLEFEDGTRMDGNKAEHIREAAAVVGLYADIIGIRAFAGLKDRNKDLAEETLLGFVRYSGVPILNLESANGHPLQALADSLTIHANRTKPKPKVVLSWAPHPRALPQAVPNSFVNAMRKMDVELHITHPKGYELNPDLVGRYSPVYEQEEALQGADFVYVKNWSSFTQYGQVLSQDASWMMTPEKLGSARFMHCLPLRRNVVVSDEVLNGPNSLVFEQAANRVVSAKLALLYLLEAMNP